jgi:pyruvate formate lyase activating enzyme
LSSVAYIKTSLLDFPGRLASVLFLPGCNFRCPYCHNAALVAPAAGAGAQGLSPLGEFLEFLDRRKSHISGVVISGGEPLLREETPRIARAIRERGLAVKLDTNGSFPGRLADVAADYVALDFKTAPAAYGRVAPGTPDAGDRVLESLAWLRARGGPFEIRITCAPGIVGAEELEAIAAALEAEDEVILQDFRPGGCLDPRWDSLAPYPPEDLRSFLAILRRSSPRARLRGA